jgi:hypothetical protein
MNHIIAENLTRNGNGADAINGRGIGRRKLTSRQRAALGADIALGVTPLAPSLKQSAAAVGISVFELRQELKAREWRRAMQQRLELQAEAEAANAQADAIVAAWNAASSMGRDAAVRTIGTAVVWEALASVVA